MKRSTKVLAVIVTLTIACVSVDARGIFGRFRRQQCQPACVPCNPVVVMGDRHGFYDPPPVKTVYYCVNGVWTARACGRDESALRELALAEEKYTELNDPLESPRTIAISVFATPESTANDNFVIADFGTLDGFTCP